MPATQPRDRLLASLCARASVRGPRAMLRASPDMLHASPVMLRASPVMLRAVAASRNSRGTI